MLTHALSAGRGRIGVDLGAARTRVVADCGSVLVDAPTLLAFDARTNDLAAVGDAAVALEGRCPPGLRLIRPVRQGTVADPDMAALMLQRLLGHAGYPRRRWRRAAVAVPHGCSPSVHRDVLAALSRIGVRRIEPVAKPLAAAWGWEAPLDRPEPVLSVVCGAATTQAAVLFRGTVIDSELAHAGGASVERAVTDHLRSRFGLVVPARRLRELYPYLAADAVGTVRVSGWHLQQGGIRDADVDVAALRRDTAVPTGLMADAVRRIVERSSADVVTELAERGVVLSGGAAAIPGLADQVSAVTGMPAHIAPDPGLAVARGLGHLLVTRRKRGYLAGAPAKAA